MPSLSEAARLLRNEALDLGFCDANFVRASSSVSYPRFRDWITQGCHAEMRYLARPEGLRADPTSILPGVQSLLMLALPWEAVPGVGEGDAFRHLTKAKRKSFPKNKFGKVASYAARQDYHDEIRRLLRQLGKRHRELFPDGRARGVVDTAPLLEREYAERAGLGEIGKNTMLIHHRYGCRVVLAALLSTEPLFDTENAGAAENTGTLPSQTRLCGDCRRCLDACPTGALVAPMWLDARKCLNYWTIEERTGVLPTEIAEKLEGRLFGCENCVDACPHGCKDATSSGIDAYVDLDRLLAMDKPEFLELYGATPLARAGLEKLKATATILRNPGQVDSSREDELV